MQRSRATVLIVEDDAELAEFLRVVMQREDYSVVVAADGSEALSLLEKLRFDLVVLDLHLPRFNSSQVMDRVESLARRMPVLLISGSPDAQQSSVFNRVDEFVAKPFGLEQIVDAADRLVERFLSSGEAEPSGFHVRRQTATRKAEA